MNGHSLASKGNRALYKAVSGDNGITDEPFWKPYCKSAEWRNKIVHYGQVYGRTDAEECLTAANGFVEHVHKRAGLGTAA